MVPKYLILLPRCLIPYFGDGGGNCKLHIFHISRAAQTCPWFVQKIKPHWASQFLPNNSWTLKPVVFLLSFWFGPKSLQFWVVFLTQESSSRKHLLIDLFVIFFSIWWVINQCQQSEVPKYKSLFKRWRGGIAQSQIFIPLFGLWAFQVSYFPENNISSFWFWFLDNLPAQQSLYRFTNSNIWNVIFIVDLAQQRCYGTLLIITLLKEWREKNRGTEL